MQMPIYVHIVNLVPGNAPYNLDDLVLHIAYASLCNRLQETNLI